MIRRFGLTLTLLAALALPSFANERSLTTTVTNNYGVPSGLIDMPTAEMAPDGQISINISHFDGYTKNTATFQLTPWLTGSFRYIGINDLTPLFDIYYDRSFDIRVRLLEESDYLPGVAIGLQDFLGTGVLSSEYIVATKQIGHRLRVTGGLGWGRLGSRNSIATIRQRPLFSFAGVGTGGNFRFSDYFAGDIAPFAGFSYELTDKISFSAEYSSDAYEFERQQGVFNAKSPWNFAATYKANNNLILRAFALNGQEIGINVNVTLNPRKPTIETQGPAPLPVAVRDPERINDLGWSTNEIEKLGLKAQLKNFIEKEELDFVGANIDARSAHVRIENVIFMSEAQAIGRTMRIMSRMLPASVEMFHVTVESNGIPIMTTSMSRSNLERLEYEKEDQALLATTFTDSVRFGNIPEPEADIYPKFTWSIAPSLRFSTFDPENPFRADLRARGRVGFDFGRGWQFNSAVSVRVLGNLSDINRAANSQLPNVRTPIAAYNARFGPTIDQLTLTKFARIAPDFYGRATVGYFELMYAGVSGEVLWRPVDSNLALGVEVNYVQLRALDQRFGFASHTTPGGVIPHVNGHVSAYYEFGQGYNANVHAGRYLAGDWGATFEFSREFNNGWMVGAFATLTNVSAEQFGEGSFDKGIFFRIPFSWVLGQETKRGYSNLIRPIQRDGGQRVSVPSRLYDLVRTPQRGSVAASWGKFWK